MMFCEIIALYFAGRTKSSVGKTQILSVNAARLRKLLRKFEDIRTKSTYSAAEFFNDQIFQNYSASCFPHISVLLNQELPYRV